MPGSGDRAREFAGRARQSKKGSRRWERMAVFLGVAVEQRVVPGRLTQAGARTLYRKLADRRRDGCDVRTGNPGCDSWGEHSGPVAAPPGVRYNDPGSSSEKQLVSESARSPRSDCGRGFLGLFFENEEKDPGEEKNAKLVHSPGTGPIRQAASCHRRERTNHGRTRVAR
jgi:hypothetical protein